MSLVREIMDEAQGVVNGLLGNACALTDTHTLEETPDLSVIITSEVEWYQGGQFAGVVSTGVFDLAACSPKIGNQLNDLDTGIAYKLEAVKSETPSKIEFVLGEI